MFASAALTDPQGTTSNFELAVTERDGELLVERPAATTLRQTIPGLGAQVALADLDGDSTMEIISSRATSSKEEDGILAHRIVDHGADLLAEVPTGPVSAVAVCPFDGENPLTVIAAVESELWVLR
jgi:hypothetical protein